MRSLENFERSDSVDGITRRRLVGLACDSVIDVDSALKTDSEKSLSEEGMATTELSSVVEGGRRSRYGAGRSNCQSEPEVQLGLRVARVGEVNC